MTAARHSVTEEDVTVIIRRRAGQIRQYAAEETRRRCAVELDIAGYHAAADYLRRTR